LDAVFISVRISALVDEGLHCTNSRCEAAQDTIGRTGDEIVRQQLAVPPTLTIRPGFPVRVMVTRDLILEPLGEVR